MKKPLQFLVIALSICVYGPGVRAAIAEGEGKYLGCAHSAAQAGGDLEVAFLGYFDQIVPENGSKWGSVERIRDVMNWSALDSAYNLAKSRGLPFRFHVLIWGSQQPGWLGSLSEAELLEELIEWFDAVAERYPDIDYLEVVNEPINQPPTKPEHGVYLEALGGTGVTGFDWVITAFELARARFPDTPLVLNEYGVLDAGTRTNQYIGLVNLLMERDLLDVIGVQGHAFETTSQYGHTVAKMTADLDRLGATGLPVIITEMDVDGVTGTELDDTRQLLEYQRLFPMFWEHPSVIGVTLWGYRPGMWRTEQGAYLVLEDGTERPAMQWLRQYVAETQLPSLLGKYPVLNYWSDTGDWLGRVYTRLAPWYWTEYGWLYGDPDPADGNGMWLYFPK